MYIKERIQRVGTSECESSGWHLQWKLHGMKKPWGSQLVHLIPLIPAFVADKDVDPMYLLRVHRNTTRNTIAELCLFLS